MEAIKEISTTGIDNAGVFGYAPEVINGEMNSRSISHQLLEYKNKFVDCVVFDLKPNSSIFSIDGTLSTRSIKVRQSVNLRFGLSEIENKTLDVLTYVVKSLEQPDVTFAANKFIQELESDLVNYTPELNVRYTTKIFNKFYTEIKNSNLNLIEAVLDQINVDRFPLQCLVNILSVTYTNKKELGVSRTNFWHKVNQTAVDQIGENRAELIIAGFK